ncbi:DUF2513 domain-containing protein [Pseudogemmobacter blasticus]|uniref:DUF2513 domain-containing protein n=1 Tax=Fuscovulum blasticum TaxID=1075 RepID=UPI0015E6D9F5|nr:DUF2513 domain-containing protein [Fuscovulum blasticum]
MRRDEEHIRKLLLEYESEDDWLLLMPGTTTDATPDELKERYHILLMMDAGLLAIVGSGAFRITNSGHDYLEAIRDDGIWKKTLAVVAETGGNATLELIKTLALGLLKAKIEQHTGLKL